VPAAPFDEPALITVVQADASGILHSVIPAGPLFKFTLICYYSFHNQRKLQ
jgi:hypothetical protein